jgi:hypothetical protein
MGFKKYLIASIILLGLISGFVYSLDLGTYTLHIETGIQDIVIDQTLPIFVWVLIPALLLFIATILHLMFYGSVNFIQNKVRQNDIKAIEDHIQNRIINKNSSKKVKTKELAELAKIIDQLEINVKTDNFKCENEKLKATANIANEVLNENKFVSLKNLKLDEKNELELKNIINRIDADDNFAFEVLKSPDKYDREVVEHAFDVIIEKKSIDRMKNVMNNFPLTNEMVTKILLKDSKEPADKRFTNAEILEFVKNNDFSNEELIQIAKNYKRTMQPEQLIKLFEDISAADESKTESYLYVLFEYEMIPQIKEILSNSQKDEYTIFKALMDLKDAGKHYNLDSLKLS